MKFNCKQGKNKLTKSIKGIEFDKKIIELITI